LRSVGSIHDEKVGPGQGKAELRSSKKLENVSQIKSITASGNVKIVQNERMAVMERPLR
jgi:hypothetical protein